jgi:RimJ/RimL family protein N-acetyltransferase
MDHSPPVSIPYLRTSRLLLREFRVEDFDSFAVHLSNPLSTTFISKVERKEAWRMFGTATGAWLLQGAGWWSMEARDSGKVVGTVGAFFREGWPEIEVGWNTYRAFWGRGFATEAASEVLRYAFEVRKEARVTALIDAGNTASLRVAAHLGMHHEA